MIVFSAILIFSLLYFAPINFVVTLEYDFSQIFFDVSVKILRLDVVSEKIFVDKNGVGYSGTVDGRVGAKNNLKNSGQIFKSIAFHKVIVALAKNFANTSPLVFVMEQFAFCNLCPVVCALTNCQVATFYNAFAQKSSLKIIANCSISIAELSFCLLKQEVQKWKIRR